MSKLGIKYNFKKSVFNGTEKKFGVEHHKFKAEQLPSEFDLTTLPLWAGISVLKQSQLGSCTCNSTGNAIRYCLAQKNGINNEWLPSRLYMYYFGRLFEGTPVTEDSGIALCDLMNAIQKYGACHENPLWPYDISKFTIQPSKAAIMDAHHHCNKLNFHIIQQDLIHIKQAINNLFPIVFGIQVYDSFESDEVAQTGMVPVPNIHTEQCLGGHAILLVGYNDNTKLFKCLNSWGNWGQGGYFYLPYDYVLNANLASDFIQITSFS
jgi:C1A family cysteine protease